MSKEAMKLALEGAANYIDALGGDSRKYRQAIANEALDKKAENARELGLDYEPAQQEPDWKSEYLKSVESGCITLDELREANAELDATNRQVEILSDALAESRREIDALVALARADEREACAKVVDAIEARCIAKDVDDPPLEHVAAAIRARSNT